MTRFLFLLMVIVSNLPAMDLFIEPIPLPTPKQYEARLRIEPFLDSVHKVEITRLESPKSPRRIPIREVEPGVFVDGPLRSNTLYQYSVVLLNPERERLRHWHQRLKTPEDLVVPRHYQQSQSEVRHLGRLFLEKESQWSTQGFPLKLIALEVQAKEARLQTYSNAELAQGRPARSTNPKKLGAPGLTGGLGKTPAPIRWLAAKGTGVLTVTLLSGNGFNGGNGRRGRAGKAGSPGQPAQAYRNPQTGQPYCRKPPTSGGPGGPGQNGGDGGRGGEAGHLQFHSIRILQADALALRKEFLPGHGGKGGRPGAGGPGGPGGLPGKNQTPCKPAAQGPGGANGKSGRVGKGGKHGRVESICFQLGQERIGNCD